MIIGDLSPIILDCMLKQLHKEPSDTNLERAFSYATRQGDNDLVQELSEGQT